MRLGLNVEWNGDTKTVVVTNGGPLYITFQIGVNGYTFAKTAPMELSGAPILVNSTTYVPADVFTDLLQYTVTNENGTVNIVTKIRKLLLDLVLYQKYLMKKSYLMTKLRAK